jgi:hypothetical protein
MTEPVKVTAPMARPSDSSIRELRWMPVRADDAVGAGRVDGRHGDQTGGHADQAVEGGDQLRHRGHGDLARDHRADAAADRHAAQDQGDGQGVEQALGPERGKRGGHGDGHADHAVAVAGLAGGRARQAAQGQDEQNPGDEVENGGEIGVH